MDADSESARSNACVLLPFTIDASMWMRICEHTIAGASDQHVVDEAMRKTRLSVLDFPLRTIDSKFVYDVRFAVAREEPVSAHTHSRFVCLRTFFRLLFKSLATKNMSSLTCMFICLL